MRIAVTCSGYGVVARGVETFIRDLMTRLLASHPDWQFDVYTRAPSGTEAAGIRRIHVPAVSRYSRAAKLYAQIGHRLGFFLRTPNNAEGLSFAIAVAPKLVRQKYDLVFNQAGPFTGWLLSKWRRLGGPPFAHKTASGYSPLELLMKRQRPDLIVATSPFVEDWLRSEPPDVPVTCIPNAVDCEAFAPASRDAAVTPLGMEHLRPPIILFVGAMEPMKRPELVIKAVKELAEGSLVMVGDGSLFQEVRRRGSEELGPDRFLSIPCVSRADLPSYYQAADIFTLPSEEPFGIVFLEALACNLPVIANNSPVQSWLLGEAGVTCNCEDTAEYAAAIREMLNSDFAGRPRLRAESFEWKSVAALYEEVFISLARSAEPQCNRSETPVIGRSE